MRRRATLLWGALACGLACDTPTQSQVFPRIVYVLVTIDGRAVPTAEQASSMQDSVFPAVLGVEYQFDSDTSAIYSRWDGLAHRQSDGSVTYTCSFAIVGFPVRYRMRADSMFLSPLNPYNGNPGFPLWVLFQGTKLVEPTIWGEWRYVAGPALKNSCPTP
jgi:hypothetical protein